ncbi:MAG: HAD hydrolase-like protein [Candidatus Peregrinibacteria bacterium]
MSNVIPIRPDQPQPEALSLPEEVENIVWDVDGTLVPTPDMLAAGHWALYQAVTNGLNRQTNLLRAEVAQMKSIQERRAARRALIAQQVRASMSDVFVEERTVDCDPKKLLDRMALLKRTEITGPQRERIKQTAAQAFFEGRDKHYKLVTGIRALLEWLQQQGFKQYALSDAPASKLAERIDHFQLAPFLEKVIGQRDPLLDRSALSGELAGKLIEIDQQKPHIDLAQVLGIEEQRRRFTVVVGDNSQRDVELARENGCIAVHALWADPEEGALEKLGQVAPMDIVQRNVDLRDVAERPILAEEMDGRHGKGVIISATQPGHVRSLLGPAMERIRRSQINH